MKKYLLRPHIVASFALFFTLFVQAGLLMPYHKIAIKDLDQVTALIKSKIQESKKSSSGKIVPLKEALQAVYVRPDSDGMIAKVISPLKAELEAVDGWEKAHQELVTEAINALTNTRAFKADIQLSYILFLENVINEMKPYIKNDGFEKKIIRQIAGAKFDLTKEALSEMKLRLMIELQAPNKKAQKLIEVSDEHPKDGSAEQKSEGL